MSTIMTCFDCL